MRWKRICLLYLLLPAFCAVNAENQPPVIKNAKVYLNEDKHQVYITYDVNDPEQDQIEITVRYRSNAGKMARLPSGILSGDVGFPIVSGRNKRIVCGYSPETTAFIRSVQIELTADDHYKMELKPLLERTDTTRIRETLRQIAGPRTQDDAESYVHLNEVRKLLSDMFAAHGLYTYKQDTAFVASKQSVAMLEKSAGVASGKYEENREYEVRNIIGEIQGEVDPNKVFIVSAHYDAVAHSPGADDNASGVTGMLEIMQLLSTCKFRNTIRFVGFDQEEKGLWGSALFTDKSRTENDNIAGVINLDMIGYYAEQPHSQDIPQGFDQLFPEQYKTAAADGFRGNFILNTSNTSSGDLGMSFARASGKYVPVLKVVSITFPDHMEGIASSDHAAFWTKGYKAIFIGDGANSRNKNYHSKRDDITSINYVFMNNVIKATAATVIRLAGIMHCTTVVCVKERDVTRN